MESTLTSIISTATQTTTLLTSSNDSATTSGPHHGILNQLFLQSTTCQIITGFFAWAALLITAHHVITILKISRGINWF